MSKNKKQKDIPEGWKMVDLGDLGKVSMCKRILKDQTLPAGDIPFFKIGTFGKEPDAYISKKIYNEFREKYSFPKTGDILISASGTIGRTVIYDGVPSYFQDSNIIWIANSEDLISNLYLSHLYKRIRWSTASGTIARLYNDLVKSTTVMAPPLPEQNRIVSVLETWDSGIEKLQQKIAIKKEIKKGLMQELLTGKKRLPGFSDKWQDLEFEKCLDVLKKPKGLKSSEYKAGGYSIFDQSDNKYISGYTHDEQFIYNYSLENSVILFGDHSRTIKYIYQKCAFGNDGIKLFQGNNISDTRFMYYRLLIQEVPNTGYNRHFKYLKEEIFSLPLIEEQKAIASILSTADIGIATLKKKLNYWQEQKKYLLNNLITGQIRTPNNLQELITNNYA